MSSCATVTCKKLIVVMIVIVGEEEDNKEQQRKLKSGTFFNFIAFKSGCFEPPIKLCVIHSTLDPGLLKRGGSQFRTWMYLARLSVVPRAPTDPSRKPKALPARNMIPREFHAKSKSSSTTLQTQPTHTTNHHHNSSVGGLNHSLTQSIK